MTWIYLHRMMSKLSRTDINLLCMYLRINPEHLASPTASNVYLVRKLLIWCKNSNKTIHLIAYLQEHHADITTWIEPYENTYEAFEKTSEDEYVTITPLVIDAPVYKNQKNLQLTGKTKTVVIVITLASLLFLGRLLTSEEIEDIWNIIAPPTSTPLPISIPVQVDDFPFEVRLEASDEGRLIGLYLLDPLGIIVPQFQLGSAGRWTHNLGNSCDFEPEFISGRAEKEEGFEIVVHYDANCSSTSLFDVTEFTLEIVDERNNANYVSYQGRMRKDYAIIFFYDETTLELNNIECYSAGDELMEDRWLNVELLKQRPPISCDLALLVQTATPQPEFEIRLYGTENAHLNLLVIEEGNVQFFDAKRCATGPESVSFSQPPVDPLIIQIEYFSGCETSLGYQLPEFVEWKIEVIKYGSVISKFGTISPNDRTSLRYDPFWNILEVATATPTPTFTPTLTPTPTPSLTLVPEFEIKLYGTENADIDLYALDSSGEKIYYDNPVSNSGGWLHDDIICDVGPERITYNQSPDLPITIEIHYYDTCESSIEYQPPLVEWRIEVIHNGFKVSKSGLISIGERISLSYDPINFLLEIATPTPTATPTLIPTLTPTPQVQIELLGDNTAFLDLYVTDRDGETVFYDNTTVVSGGKFGEDINCEYGTERVTWPSFSSSPFTIKIHYADICLEQSYTSKSWALTVNGFEYTGEISPYEVIVFSLDNAGLRERNRYQNVENDPFVVINLPIQLP